MARILFHPMKGRGAVNNPQGRFEKTARAVFEDGWDDVHAADWNPDEIVYVINAPALDETRPTDAAVSFSVYKPNRVGYEVTTSVPAYLVLSEADFPGWRATVDGKPVPIYRANSKTELP